MKIYICIPKLATGLDLELIDAESEIDAVHKFSRLSGQISIVFICELVVGAQMKKYVLESKWVEEKEKPEEMVAHVERISLIE